MPAHAWRRQSRAEEERRTRSIRSAHTTNRAGAIVLGGNFVGLGLVRSLGEHGIPVWVLDTDRSRSIAQFSRYTKRFIVVPKEETLETLLRVGREHQLNG